MSITKETYQCTKYILHNWYFWQSTHYYPCLMRFQWSLQHADYYHFVVHKWTWLSCWLKNIPWDWFYFYYKQCFFFTTLGNNNYFKPPFTSAWTSSIYIEFEFHRVSNCRVWASIKLDFCSSISSFGSSNSSFSIFSS